MTALTAERAIATRRADDFADPVAAARVIYAGALVVLSATGWAQPGTTAAGLIARGVAQETVDNATGANGDQTVPTRSGCFRFVNNAGDVLRTHIGTNAYIVDDQTVSSVATGRSVAGLIKDVDADGVWVQVG